MPQFDRQAFGQRLRLLRDYREMTQQQVANFLNVDRSTYSYYENGKTEPSITVLMRMAELFSVTLDSLLNMEKDRDISLDQKCSCWNLKMESENCGNAKKRKSLHIFRTCGQSYKYKKEIKKVIDDLILQKGVTTFYVGSNGNFDRMVQSVLIDLKKQYPNLECCTVLAYMPSIKSEFDTGYEKLETLYPDGLEKVPKRFAIDWRNKWMVQQSDYVISYVCHSFGGAAKYMELAKRKKKIVYNLANL